MKLRKIGWSVLLVAMCIAFATTVHSWPWGKKAPVVKKAEPLNMKKLAELYTPELSKAYTFEKGVFKKSEALAKAYYVDYLKTCANGYVCRGPKTVEDADCRDSQFGNIQATVPNCHACRVKQEYVDRFRGDMTCPSGGFLFMSVTPFGFRCLHSFTSDQEKSSVNAAFSCPSGYLKNDHSWQSGSGYNLIINCDLEELGGELRDPSDLGMECSCGYYVEYYALGYLDVDGNPLYPEVSAPEYVCGLDLRSLEVRPSGLERLSPPVE